VLGTTGSPNSLAWEAETAETLLLLAVGGTVESGTPGIPGGNPAWSTEGGTTEPGGNVLIELSKPEGGEVPSAKGAGGTEADATVGIPGTCETSFGAGGKEESANGGSVVSEEPGGGTIPLSIDGKELFEVGSCAIESDGKPALFSKGGKGLLVSPGAGGKELSAKGGKTVSAGPGGEAILLSKGGKELSDAGSWAIGLGGNPTEPLSKGGRELLSLGTVAAAMGDGGKPALLSTGGSAFVSPGNPGTAARDEGGKDVLLSSGGNPFESPGKADGTEAIGGGETSPGGAKAGKLLSAMGSTVFESPGNPGAAASGAGETGGNSDCGAIPPEPELGGFPEGNGGKDRSPEGAVLAAGSAGKALDESTGKAGMELSVPKVGGIALLFDAPAPGRGGKELSDGMPVAGDPTGGNPPELELSAGRGGRPELESPVGGKAGKPELSEDNPGAAGGKLLFAELSAGRAGNPGFEFPIAPCIGGVELSLVKGGKAGEPVGGIDELSAPRGGRAVPLS
jgi:hypothetical protein